MYPTGSDYFMLFADESFACAHEATTEKGRSHYLAMAYMWNHAAAKQQRDENERARLARGNSAPRPTRWA